MPPSFKQLFLSFVFLIVANTIKAQTCSIQMNDTNICEGTTVSFGLTLNGGVAASYTWSFGDGFTATTTTPNHTYTTPGNYIPTVTINIVGGGNCLATGKLVRVFSRPNSRYTITSDDSLCFKGNKLCIIDQSFPGSSNAPIKKRVFQLSNGYLQVDSFPYSAALCYQNATDLGGHLYSLVLEVTDTNNCVGRLEKKDSVRLFPKINIAFDVDSPVTCFDAVVAFRNLSTTQLTTLNPFYWDFGDGKKDSTQWQNLIHVFPKYGPYLPVLYVWDKFNCPDTAVSPKVIRSIFPDSIIYALMPMKQCYKGNKFIHAAYNPQGKQYWTIFDAGNNVLYSYDDRVATDTFSLTTCGIFRVHLKIVFADCEFETDTFITVLGPKSIIHNPDNPLERINNIVQCEINDTIYYKTPVPYLSCINGNGGKFHLWDFGDPFAPACTTDTRKGINIGINCNFSKDSMLVKHMYTPGKELCYKTTLYIKDSLTGCEDTDTLILSLTNPNAHPDLTAVPQRKGLEVIGSCLFTELKFVFKEVLPECWYEKAWINFDSACGKDNWTLVDEKNKRVYSHIYNSTCDSSGYVTVGLIIKNGKDKNGNDCYDTAWYHHILRLSPLNSNYSYQYENKCKDYQLKLIPDDSIQFDLKVVRWSNTSRVFYNEDTFNLTYPPFIWYYYSDTIVQYFSPTDTSIQAPVFTMLEPGVYSFGVSFTNQFGCSVVNGQSIGIGFYKNFKAEKRIGCVKDSLSLLADIRYYNPNYFDALFPTEFWKIPQRAAANKEKVWWDIGDGKGFAYTGANPKIKYDTPGTYTITMVVQDSSGCLDTLVRKNYLLITDLKPAISLAQSSYLCAPQIVQFNNASVVIDSAGKVTPSVHDSIVSFNWNFGDGTVESLLRNPAHDFVTNGVFIITLTATTEWGCQDTAQVAIELKGPKASFIISDTLGCEPFQTTFVNTTGKPLQSWTWYFGDSLNQTYTTTNDSSVSFTYPKAGVYSVKILGTESVFNPTTGNTIICNSFFPDPLTNLPYRKVYVLPTPAMDVVFKDTICKNEELQLTALGDSLYKKLIWIFGDGDTLRSQRPDTITQHIYTNVGNYRFTLIPINSSGVACADTVTKPIVVTNVTADFTIDSSQTPAFIFTNQSTSAVRYQWSFGKPSAGSGNSSAVVDGAFNYGNDTGTYIVCLMAFNNEDCDDSICKEIRIIKARVIIPNVFTPDNNDDKNDAFDIDIFGFTQYELQIFNRWGTEVFKSNKDGIRNDGVNWNGRDHNTGDPCSSGTYFYIFTYKLITEQTAKTVHGTITLIR